MPDDASEIEDLRTYPEPYVTLSQLARYWRVSGRRLRRHIESGALPAIRIGPRLLRISTADARRFEQVAQATQKAEE